MRIRIFVALICAALVTLDRSIVAAEPVAVRHVEGVVHGFLVLRELDGTILANGDLIQTSRGGRVTSRVVFHFRDGSLHEETAVFSQRGHFRLVSNADLANGMVTTLVKNLGARAPETTLSMLAATPKPRLG